MPFAGYKDFGSCVSAQRKKGKSPESARKICGALQARAEGGGTARNASQASIPSDFKAHFDRAGKALDFLKQQGVILSDEEQQDLSYEVDNIDSSLVDNQVTSEPEQRTMAFQDPETYADKVTRVMDEYQLDEEEARVIVNKLIEDDMKELERREYEVMKQLQIEKAQADLISSQDAEEPEPKQEREQQQEENVQQPEEQQQ